MKTLLMICTLACMAAPLSAQTCKPHLTNYDKFKKTTSDLYGSGNIYEKTDAWNGRSESLSFHVIVTNNLVMGFIATYTVTQTADDEALQSFSVSKGDLLEILLADSETVSFPVGNMQSDKSTMLSGKVKHQYTIVYIVTAEKMNLLLVHAPQSFRINSSKSPSIEADVKKKGSEEFLEQMHCLDKRFNP